MSKNDDALRLAKSCMECHMPDMPEYKMAAHIQRLVAENEAQAALLRQAKEALIYHTQQTRPIVASQVAIHAIRQHLEGKS